MAKWQIADIPDGAERRLGERLLEQWLFNAEFDVDTHTAYKAFRAFERAVCAKYGWVPM